MDNKRFCRLYAVVLAYVAVFGVFLSGCGGEVGAGADDGRISIVCTTFPQYDWIRELIAGNDDGFRLALLTEKGGDLHSYQPSALDIARISECDMLVYVGGESDKWVEDVLRADVGSDVCAVNMMSELEGRLYEEEHIGLGHPEDGHEDWHSGGYGEYEYGAGQADSYDAVEYDEHVWLSLRNAEHIVRVLCDELSRLDAGNAKLYEKNCEAYLEKLGALDSEYEAAVETASADALVFADRFPFRYMAEDYGIECFAAFEGCSAETEASFETVASLIEAVKAHHLTAVLVLEGSDSRLARVIIENTAKDNGRVLAINSMQSVSRKDIEGGISYLNVMENNLDVLRQALTKTLRNTKVAKDAT